MPPAPAGKKRGRRHCPDRHCPDADARALPAPRLRGFTIGSFESCGVPSLCQGRGNLRRRRRVRGLADGDCIRAGGVGNAGGCDAVGRDFPSAMGLSRPGTQFPARRKDYCCGDGSRGDRRRRRGGVAARAHRDRSRQFNRRPCAGDQRPCCGSGPHSDQRGGIREEAGVAIGLAAPGSGKRRCRFREPSSRSGDSVAAAGGAGGGGHGRPEADGAGETLAPPAASHRKGRTGPALA